MRMHEVVFASTRSKRLLPVLVASVGISMLTVGCGKRVAGPVRAAVRGNITLEGDPLKTGVIRFVPIEETTGPVVFARIENGRYQTAQFNGPVVGMHRVEIDQDRDDDPARNANDPEEARAEFVRKGGTLSAVEVPEIYNRSSTLRAEVIADKTNTHDFDLDRRTSAKK